MGFTDVVKNQRGKLRLFRKRTLRRIRVWLVPAKFLSPLDQFRKAGHNRLIYKTATLPSEGSAVIFGAYLGDSIAGWLSKRASANIYAYEPVADFFEKLKARFTQHNVHLFQFGIGERDEVRNFSLLDDATSGDEWRAEKVSDGTQMHSVSVDFRSPAVLQEDWPAAVDVMEINIEGGEYELLQVLAESRLLQRVKQIVVQFHDVGEATEQLVVQARRTLEVTHRQTWCFDMVWEFWERKDIST